VEVKWSTHGGCRSSDAAAGFAQPEMVQLAVSAMAGYSDGTDLVLRLQRLATRCKWTQRARLEPILAKPFRRFQSLTQRSPDFSNSHFAALAHLRIKGHGSLLALPPTHCRMRSLCRALHHNPAVLLGQEIPKNCARPSVTQEGARFRPPPYPCAHFCAHRQS